MGALFTPRYPVTRGPREWWETHSLLGASPEMRAAQAAQFEREAQIMFKRAALALGRVEAEAMWRNIAKKKPGKAKPAANTAAKPTKMPKISSKQRALMVSADEQTLKTGTTALKATGRGLKDWQIAGGSAANLAMTSLRTKPFVPENKIYKRDVMDVLKEDYDQAPPVKRRMLQSTVFRHWRGV